VPELTSGKARGGFSGENQWFFPAVLRGDPRFELLTPRGSVPI
jgi:hypothetical protein